MKKRISIIKEKIEGEKRVILLPEDLKIFIKNGFEVFVESGAGLGVNVSDEDYSRVGAIIVDTETAWKESNIIFKYKPPVDFEFNYLNEKKFLGGVFHAEGNMELTKKLLNSKCKAYSYEFFRTAENIFPASVASSEIAGKVSIIYAAYYLQSHLGGSGVLLAPCVNVKPPKVLLIGYGNSGGAAARMASSLGADVVVLGTNREKLRSFQATMPSNVKCLLNTPDILEKEIIEADVVIGAILISTYDTEPMVDEKLIKKMKKGSIIVDVTSGYGPGYLSTFDKNTNFENPVFEKFGVLHCKIDILPAAYVSTTVSAMSKHLSYYLYEMANSIILDKIDVTSNNGLIVDGGKIIHPEVKRHMEYYEKK